MIEVKIESINKEDLNTDVLFEIANEIFKGNPKEKQAKAIKETLYNLVKKIKEEEHRRKKAENHLIEKKIRTINISEKILVGTNRKEYKTSSRNFKGEETIKHVREGNKIICTITNDIGKFQGIAIQHHEDTFDYMKGMRLARARAMKNMYIKIEESLLKQM